MKIQQIVIGIIIILVSVGLSGCTSPTTRILGEWSLVSYGTPEKQTPALPDIITSLMFNSDQTFSGNVGCNIFRGDWIFTINGGISFSNLVSTEKYCEETWAQETAVLGLLTKNAKLQIIWEDNNTIILTNGSSIVKLVRYIQETGMIRYINFEGGFYGIITDTQKQFDPVNLPETFKQDNLRIEFKALYLKNQTNIHMWGELIFILEIKQLIIYGSLTNQTTCKDHNLLTPPSNQDCISYIYEGIQHLTLTYQNAGFN